MPQNRKVGPITWICGMPFRGKRVDGQRYIAKCAGEPRYFTGRPCKNGHIAHRTTSTGMCEECAKERYARDADAIKKKASEWNKVNKERRLEIQRQSRLKNAESIKQRTRERRQTEEEKKKRREYAREWRNKYPEKRLEKERRHRARNREKFRIRWSNKNAKRKGAVGKYKKADIDLIRVRQKGKCAYCRVRLANVQEHKDHIIPLYLGGSNNPSNIQILCEPCNLKKGIKHPIDFAQSRGMLL